MTDNIITARLFIDMDGTLAAWQQAACFEDLLQENYFRDLPPYQTVVDAVRILCNAHPELDIYALSAFMPENPASVEEKYGWLDVYVPGKPRALKKKHLQISSKKIKIKQYPDYVMKIQYSTKKSFKKAKTVSNKGRLVRAIKKLKRNTTYYIRYCSNTVVDTDAGQKSVYGQWSKTLKVRTKG